MSQNGPQRYNYLILLYQYNKDDFRFQFSISDKLLNSLDTLKLGNKTKLSIKRFSLFTCYNIAIEIKN